MKIITKITGSVAESSQPINHITRQNSFAAKMRQRRFTIDGVVILSGGEPVLFPWNDLESAANAANAKPA